MQNCTSLRFGSYRTELVVHIPVEKDFCLHFLIFPSHLNDKRSTKSSITETRQLLAKTISRGYSAHTKNARKSRRRLSTTNRSTQNQRSNAKRLLPMSRQQHVIELLFTDGVGMTFVSAMLVEKPRNEDGNKTEHTPNTCAYDAVTHSATIPLVDTRSLIRRLTPLCRDRRWRRDAGARGRWQRGTRLRRRGQQDRQRSRRESDRLLGCRWAASVFGTLCDGLGR